MKTNRQVSSLHQPKKMSVLNISKNKMQANLMKTTITKINNQEDLRWSDKVQKIIKLTTITITAIFNKLMFFVTMRGSYCLLKWACRILLMIAWSSFKICSCSNKIIETGESAARWATRASSSWSLSSFAAQIKTKNFTNGIHSADCNESV